MVPLWTFFSASLLLNLSNYYPLTLTPLIMPTTYTVDSAGSKKIIDFYFTILVVPIVIKSNSKSSVPIKVILNSCQLQFFIWQRIKCHGSGSRLVMFVLQKWIINIHLYSFKLFQGVISVRESLLPYCSYFCTLQWSNLRFLLMPK